MEKIVAKVKTKYSWLTDNEADELVNNAVGWFYSLRYPCELSISVETHPIATFMDEWCVSRLCDEIAERNGFNSATGYRENGITFEFDGAWISESLKKAIMPIAGVV